MNYELHNCGESRKWQKFIEKIQVAPNSPPTAYMMRPKTCLQNPAK